MVCIGWPQKQRRIEIQQLLLSKNTAVQQPMKVWCAAFPCGSGSGLMVRIWRVYQKLRPSFFSLKFSKYCWVRALPCRIRWKVDARHFLAVPGVVSWFGSDGCDKSYDVAKVASNKKVHLLCRKNRLLLLLLAPTSNSNTKFWILIELARIGNKIVLEQRRIEWYG